MKILHLVQDKGIRPRSKKGAAVHVAAMCTAFRKLGADVTSVHASNALEARRMMEAVLGEAPIDLIYERYALDALEGSRFAASLRIPHVLEVNAPLEDEAVKWRGANPTSLNRDGESKAFQGASMVLCVSPMVADYAKTRGASPSTILVRPNAVDAELFRPMKESAANRAIWFPDLDAPFVVGFHGRLRPWHGFHRVVDACSDALRSGTNLAMLCVGEGDYQECLERALPRSRWHHEPWCDQNQLARWVAGFHTIAFGYDRETDCYFSPLKLREAMAAEVVPIVPNQGELPAAVGHGSAGVVYDQSEDDPTALSRAIQSLAKNKDRRVSLGKAARAAASRTSWTQIAEEVLDVCRARPV